MSNGNIEKQLGQVRAFIETEAYSSFVANYTEILNNAEREIVAIAPDSEAQIVVLRSLHRQRLAAMDILTFLPEFVTALEGKLEELTVGSEDTQE